MKVLLVDDSQAVRLLVQVYLMSQHAEVHEARRGDEGLELARQLQPDLVIADVQMPGLDGFQLCSAIRAEPKLARTPVVLLTSLADAASRARGREVGASGFLNKPVSPAALRSELLGLNLWR